MDVIHRNTSAGGAQGCNRDVAKPDGFLNELAVGIIFACLSWIE
ncbi:hypothetical protein [Marinobacterium marinum]|nr:hypothetical protein [Marinobacterium marinum]